MQRTPPGATSTLASGSAALGGAVLGRGAGSGAADDQARSTSRSRQSLASSDEAISSWVDVPEAAPSTFGVDRRGTACEGTRELETQPSTAAASSAAASATAGPESRRRR